MTIEEQLLGANSVLNGLTAERDDLRLTVEKLTVGVASEMEALKIEASVKDAKVLELSTLITGLHLEKDALAAKVIELEASKVSASKGAAKIAASVGVTPVSLPIDAPASAEAVSHLTTFLSLPMGSKERSDYFAAHKGDIIKGAL